MNSTRIIHPPISTRGLKCGKRPPLPDAHPRMASRLMFADFGRNLPPPPDRCDWGFGITRDMDGNDTVGDCTVCGAKNTILTDSSAAGHPNRWTRDTVLSIYSEITGYNPRAPLDDYGRNPTDTGALLLDVLSYWRKTGVNGRTIVAYLSVDFKDNIQLAQAVRTFGCVYTGIELPTATETQQVWDIPAWPLSLRRQYRPGSRGGHCVEVSGYDLPGKRLTGDTWGMRIPQTLRFKDICWTECYAIVTDEWLQKDGKSPSGYDVDGLLEALPAVHR